MHQNNLKIIIKILIWSKKQKKNLKVLKKYFKKVKSNN